MEYKIVSAGMVSELVALVNRMIKNGWRPLGNPIFQAGSYSQAMTLEISETLS